MKSLEYILTILLCLFIFCGCAPSQNSVSTDKNTTEESISKSFEESGLIDSIEKVLSESLQLESEVSYDSESKLVNIAVTAPAGMANALSVDKTAVAEDWTALSDSLAEISEATYILCLENGYKVGCTIMLFSDVNPDNIFFAALNGESFYNVMDS